MSQNWLNNTFCEDCSLKFDAKSEFDIHLSLVHKQNLVVVKEEPSLCLNEPKEEEVENDPLLLDDNATIPSKQTLSIIASVYDDKKTSRFRSSLHNGLNLITFIL